MVQRVRIGGGSSARGTEFGFQAGVTRGTGQALIGFGRELGNVAGHFAAEDAREQKRQDMVTAAEDRGRALKDIDERVADLDPAAPDYVEQVEQAYQAAIDQVFESTQIQDDDVLANLQVGLTNISQEAGLRARATKRQDTETRALTALQEAENRMLEGIASDPDGGPVFHEEFTAAYAEVADALPQSQRETLFDSIMTKATRERVLALAGQGREAEARSLLEANAGSFNQKERKAVDRQIKTAGAQLLEEQKRANTAQIAALEIGIIEGTVSTADVTAARDRGLFAGQERTEAVLRRQIQARDRKALDDAAETAELYSRFNSGGGLRSEKEAETVYNGILESLGNPTEGDELAVAKLVTQEGGVVPRNIKQQIKVGGTTTSPERLARAAELHGSLIQDSPSVDTGANDRVSTVAALVSTFGEDPVTAARQVIDGEPTESVRAQRKAEFRDLEFEPTAGLEEAGFDEDLIPAGMREDYRRVVQTFYERSGDIEVAQAAANERIVRNYGSTNIGGVEQLVKKPPELFAVPVNLGGPATDPDARELRTAVIDEIVMRSLLDAGLFPEIPAGTAEERLRPGKIGFNEAGIPIILEGESREQVSTSGLPPYKLTLVPRSNPPRYSVTLLNEFGSYTRVGFLDGITESEAKATRAWQDFEANSSKRLEQGQEDAERTARAEQVLGREAERNKIVKQALDDTTKEVRETLAPQLADALRSGVGTAKQKITEFFVNAARAGQLASVDANRMIDQAIAAVEAAVDAEIDKQKQIRADRNR